MSRDDDLVAALRAIVGDAGLLLGADVAARSAGAFRSDSLRARVLVRPASTGEVAAVMRECHARGQVVVPQGGRTGLVHGSDAQADHLILSLERLNRIELVDPVQRIAVVEAGVTLQQLQQAALARDLFFALDLGARGSATIGGNVATNAGGNRVIRYGMTRELVLGLEAVLAGALEAGLAADAVVAGSERERAALWALRDDVAQTGRHGPQQLFDVSLQLRHMKDYVETVQRGLRARFPGAHVWTFGHLGDGNLHFGVCVPGADAAARRGVEEEIYRPLAAIDGSISAEHGIGLEKRPWLDVSRSATEVAAMRALKKAFDPRALLNPGKVVA